MLHQHTPDQLASPSPTRRPHPLMVLRLSGSQREMGAQHGEFLRNAGGYEGAVDYYPRLVERMLRGSQVGTVARTLPTLARPAVEVALHILEARRAPDLRARSRAFSQALGRPAHMSRYNAVMDVLQNLIGLAGQHPWGRIPRGVMAAAPAACSTLAIWGDGTRDARLLHARNFDFPGAKVWDKAPAIVFCNPNDGLRYGFTSTRGADTPGVTAFNEAGLAITVHTRFHQDVSFSGTTLVDAAHDIIRKARTLAEALDLAKAARWASTWGLLVSSAAERTAALIEVSGRHMSVVTPRPGEAFLVSTNRYRSPDFHAREVEPTPGWTWYSDGRTKTLTETARRAMAEGGLDVADLQSLMGSHEDPEVPGFERAGGGILAQPIGVQTVVIDAEQAAIELSVGDFPTGKGPYLRVPWRWSSGPEVEVVTAQASNNWQLTTLEPTSKFDGGASAEAYGAFSEAARHEAMGAPWTDVEGAVERAAKLDPGEPSYQLLVGGCRLRRGDFEGARAAFADGLQTERSPFPRGRLLLWSARTAEALGEPERAASERRELLAIDHPLLGLHHDHAKADARRPCSRWALRQIPVHVQLCDLG